MTDQKPLSLDQYRTALTIDRQQAVELLAARAELRRLQAEVLAERRRLISIELAELRRPTGEQRRRALKIARKEARQILPLLDEARRVEQEWRMRREYGHVWDAVA